MRIDIVSIFPGLFAEVFQQGTVRRARDAGILGIAIHNLRDWATDRHRTVDDAPYGGGPGMVMRPEPWFAAVEALLEPPPGATRGAAEVILLTPQGRVLDDALTADLATRSRLVLLCGRFEGVDERVRAHLATLEVSIGDYVLSGGEPAAIVLIDAVVRRIPNVLGSADSVVEESHAQGLLEYPQYTRPAQFRGWRVPDVLLSGDHGAIARWRRAQALRRTQQRRPDLWGRASAEDDVFPDVGEPDDADSSDACDDP